jgi:hypothetical protein
MIAIGPPSVSPIRAARYRHRIGDAGAALVEAQHAAERAKTVQVVRERRLVPHDVEVLQPIRDQQNLERA